MQIRKKLKWIFTLFITMFIFSVPINIAKAEQVPEQERTAEILMADSKGYSVSLPEYVMNSKNTEIIQNDNYKIYVNKTKLNDDYGILTFVFRADKLVENNSMTIEVPQAVPYKGITDFDEVNWANSIFMKSFSGGTRNNDKIGFFNVENMLKYSTFQFGFIYNLKDEDKIDFKLKDISNEEYEKLKNTTEDSYSTTDTEIVKNILDSESSKNISSDSENVNFIPISEEKEKAEKEENAKDSYNQNKTDGEVVKESKYPWLLPSSIIASIVILAIVIYIMRKYVKNK